MERDCYDKDCIIAASFGLSLLIKNMGENFTEVLGWDEKQNGMVKAKQTNFMHKGVRKCVQLTYNDGRKLILTPNHRLLTSNNEWVTAENLKIGVDKIKCSVTYPVMDIKAEIEECKGWSLDVGTIKLTTTSTSEYLKTLSFARIMGYLITDGHLNNKPHGNVWLGHELDVERFLDDLKKFQDIQQTNFVSKNLYNVRFSNIFTRNILKLKGFITGRKSTQAALLPEFIIDENCPRPIVREFLAGVFGGDGHTCVLGMHRGKRDILTSPGFSQTKSHEHLESLNAMMEQIQILFKKCGIHKTTIQKPKETSHSKEKYAGKDNTEKHFEINLHLDISELIPFSEKIGFRYCCHKSQRLEAGVAYRRLREETIRQRSWLINRIDKITGYSKIKSETPNKIVNTKKATQQAIDELKKIEPIVHKYVIPTGSNVTDALKYKSTMEKFRYKNFPTAAVFMKEVGAFGWFNDGEDNCYGVCRGSKCLPTMELTLIDRRDAGEHDVYDIEVEKVNSFSANGLVSHNCMISHGASRFTKDRIYHASDAYQVYTCQKCGLIAVYNHEKNIHVCNTCKNYTHFNKVEIPYAFKLLMQELITMNIAPRIKC